MTDPIRLEYRHRYGADYDLELAVYDEYPSLADAPADELRARRCDKALAALEHDDREPFTYVVIAGMTTREAAAELGWFHTSGHLAGEPNGRRVWRRVQRAKRLLRYQLVSDGPDEELEGWEAA